MLWTPVTYMHHCSSKGKRMLGPHQTVIVNQYARRVEIIVKVLPKWETIKGLCLATQEICIQEVKFFFFLIMFYFILL